MKSHARMHKTLASLALAMTATAIFLHAMDPTVRAARSQASPGEMASIFRDLVVDSVTLRPGQWRDVEIVLENNPGDGLVLAASRDQRKCHFFVDAAGRLSRETQWSRQLPHSDAPHSVKIHVQRGNAGPELLSPDQLLALQSLVSVLDSAIAGNGKLPVQVRSSDATGI